MKRETAIVEVWMDGRKMREDLEVPLNISVSDLLEALKSIYGLETGSDDMRSCYLKSEDPIALLRGSRNLSEFGVRNGTIIHITK